MMKRLGTLVPAIALIAFGGWMALRPAPDNMSGPASTLLPAAAMADTTPAPDAADAKLPEVTDFSIGSPDAKVTMIEYGSFTCPHCADFHSEVWPELKRDYVDTGKVKFMFREVYFDKYGLWAGMMARCGGQMRYFGIVDILYDTQREWAASQDPGTVVANLRKIGLSAGLTNPQLDACMNDAKMVEALVAHYQETATADKIEGTPSFVIDGTTYKNMAYSEMKKIIDAELAK